ncbi:relaxase/mobilization nuclease domain-containing protein, partial [Klebsiella pneumoniae]|uniref:relaxase/mobilization nuclease domain-containing protein n=1 Tax=Klebsiella pneumoniae TaxID=573 RepID=UPI0013C2AC2B
VYTHTDKDHIHNHIVINAVNYEDGRKFHAHGQEAIDRFRDVSDELCKKHGFSIVEERSADVRYTLAEQSLLQKGESSWKDEIRTAIDSSKE